MRPLPRPLRLAALALVLLVPTFAQEPGATPDRANPERWVPDIERFAALDRENPPQPGGVVFTGSSSIRLWTTLAADLPGLDAVNRGFGGSHLAHVVRFVDRLVLVHQPRLVVVYAGENDLQDGASAEDVLASFRALADRIHAARADTRLVFLAIKESPSRPGIREKVLAANRLVAAECARRAGCVFVDVATPMLDAEGRTRPELFREDRLHLNAAGYAIWTRALAPHLAP
jgi:lysophospholipase L1-like esterase